MQESEVGSPNKKAKIVLKSDTQPVNMPENIKSAFNWLGRDARGKLSDPYRRLQFVVIFISTGRLNIYKLFGVFESFSLLI